MKHNHNILKNCLGKDQQWFKGNLQANLLDVSIHVLNLIWLQIVKICSQIRFKTWILTSSLSDYRRAYIIVRWRVTKVRHVSDVAIKVAERAFFRIVLFFNCGKLLMQIGN